MNTRSAPTRVSSRLNRSEAQPGAAPARTTRAASALRPPADEPTKKNTTTRTTRQPLVNRDNAATESKPALTKKGSAKSAAATKAASKAATTAVTGSGDREPIKAFLRIRPQLSDGVPASSPYLNHLSDVSVRMVDPAQDATPGLAPYPRFRPSTAPTSAIYTFSHIFPPETQQDAFFAKTTLPLVHGLLAGENGLLFAYGITNSGKTYTIQGGGAPGSAGILPRALDILFNSIDGLQSPSKYRPVRLHGVELEDSPLPAAIGGIFSRGPSLAPVSPSSTPALADVLAEQLDPLLDTDADTTSLTVDRNYEYSVWLSYSEVYNEKVYDLLSDVDPSSSSTRSGSSNANPALTQRILLTRKALSIRPSPPSDAAEGKYVAGLRQIRVRNAAEAKDLVRIGQLHRRVFGTLANSQSSRSHGIVTIKLLRKHRGERDEPGAYTTARLTLVDLAGSERTKHTQTSGDRLREAGSINKSLMVLGQCMEVMRTNQRRIAAILGGPTGERADTRDVKKTLAVVPFRHSKLTEVLMDYFVGDGRTVMIVNVNPYDTGFDENAHVMKFAALAKEVHTPAPVQHPFPRLKPSGIPQLSATERERPSIAHHRHVTLSTGGRAGRKASEARVDIVEEDEDVGDEDDYDDGADDPLSGLVEALFDEIDALRMQLADAEERAALVEATTREEVMHEVEGRMQEMERMYARRLIKEVEQQEMKMDAKIDMLHRSGLFGKTPGKAKRVLQALSESDSAEDSEEDVERSILDDDDEDENNNGSHRPSRSVSPLAGKSKRVGTATRVSEIRVRTIVPSGPAHIPLASDESNAETGTAAETESQVTDDTVDDEDDEETDDGDEDYCEDDSGEVGTEEDTGEPSPEAHAQATPRRAPRPSPALNHFNPSASRGLPPLSQAPSPIFEKDVKARAGQSKLSTLAGELDALRLSDRPQGDPMQEEWDADSTEDSMILPAKGTKKGPARKKKPLGTKPVVTGEEIEMAAQAGNPGIGKSIKRMTRSSR